MLVIPALPCHYCRVDWDIQRSRKSMKTYEQRRREEFETWAKRNGRYTLDETGEYLSDETNALWDAFSVAHRDFQTIADFVAMFPTKAAAARALNVDNKQLNRWENAQAVLIGGVIYNRRKKDQ